MMGFRRLALAVGLALAVIGPSSAAIAPVPKTVAKALKITRGKPFSEGLVFFDGRYIEPPYTVERYGNAIRINGIQVTGAVVPWDEFLKTQKTVPVEKNESAEPAPEPEPEPEPEEEDDEDAGSDDDPLSDLFDDSPAPAKKAKKSVAKAKAAPPAPKTPAVRLAGEFEMNDRARGLVSKINQTRLEIDAALRKGGFFFFGSSYSRVSGDRGTMRDIMRRLPEVMRVNSDLESFRAAARDAGFVYFPDRLVKQLHRNRADYLKLQKRYKQMESDDKLDSILNGL